MDQLEKTGHGKITVTYTDVQNVRTKIVVAVENTSAYFEKREISFEGEDIL